MFLTLIRPGKTKQSSSAPVKLWPLSEEGVGQIQALAAIEDLKKVELIFSNLSLKALETSVILAKANQVPIETEQKLAEITSFTNEFIRNKDTFTEVVRQYYSKLIPKIAGGESIKEALTRFNKAIENIVLEAELRNLQNIGIVSDGNILAFFSGQYREKTAYEIHNSMKFPDYAVLNWSSKKFVKFFGDK